MVVPRSRLASIPLIAGQPVLDLVNTVSWRGAPERSEDHLQEPEHGLIWAHRSGVLSDLETDRLRAHLAAHPRAGEIMAGELRRLRDVVAPAVLDPTPQALADAQEVILEAIRHSHLHPSDGSDGAVAGPAYRWQVTDLDEHTVARRLALNLEVLLRSPSGRIGVCADPACQWVFLDTSRGHRRQWCSSTDCGNRHRVQRHQQRSRAASPGPAAHEEG